MGGNQNYGPLLGTLNIRCRIIIGIQKGTIILTTTHINIFQRVLGANPIVVPCFHMEARASAEPSEEARNGSSMLPKLGFRVQGLGFRVQGLGFRV